MGLAEPLRGNNHIAHDGDSGDDGDEEGGTEDDEGSYLGEHRVSMDDASHGSHGGGGDHGHGHGHGTLKYLNRIGEIQETHDALYFDSAIEVGGRVGWLVGWLVGYSGGRSAATLMTLE